MNNNPFNIACQDITATNKRLPLVMLLGWHDIRQRYQRSSIGPFWITLSMSVTIITISIVFSQVFHILLNDFLPFISIGIILWAYMSNVISEGCSSFIAAENIIKQLPVPIFVHILRPIWRNILILGHNIVIIPIVLIIFGKPLGLIALLIIPGFLLATINLIWVALIMATLCARYRDMPQIVASIMQVAFYITPIIWMPKSISNESSFFIDFNPFYHIIETMRAPLLGTLPSITNWIVSSLMTIIGSFVAILFFGCYRRRIAYWL